MLTITNLTKPIRYKRTNVEDIISGRQAKNAPIQRKTHVVMNISK